MSETSDKHFWDTNLWVYLLVDGATPEDQRKTQVVRDLLLQPEEIVISVQVLNEFANVLFKKYKATYEQVSAYITGVSKGLRPQIANEVFYHFTMSVCM